MDRKPSAKKSKKPISKRTDSLSKNIPGTPKIAKLLRKTFDSSNFSKDKNLKSSFSRKKVMDKTRKALRSK